MRRLAVPLAVLALGAAAPAADAVTPQQARAVAERAIAAGPDAGPFQHHGALMPAQRRRFRPVVEIHTLRRVLRAGTLVGQGLEGRRKMYRVKAPAVLAWGDYAPGAGFAHPSRLVVVDRRTNRVVHNRVIGWWPEVNNRRVFVRGRGQLRTPNNSPGRRRGRAAVVPGFKNDCLVTIGDRTDPYFLKGMGAMSAMAQRHGMPIGSARRVQDLGPTIDRLADGNPPCTDVIIYVAAHGWAPPNTDVPNVATSEKARVTIKAPAGGGNPPVEENLDHDDIKRIIHNRPKLSFKFVIEACFSGRWTTLMAEPNLRITLTSSRADEVTFLAVTHAANGRQVKGQIEWQGGTVGDPDGAGDPPPFTKGVTQAIDTWAADPANQNGEAGQALGYAGTHRDGDRARELGWQHGRTDDRTDTRPHAQPGAGQPTPFSINVTPSFRHLGTTSETCWGVQTSPARRNARVTITVRGPNNYSESRTDSTNSSGFVRLRTGISQTGTYTAEVHVTAEDGATASGSSSITVTSAPGNCPPP